MILNGNEYKLIFLDTNAIREILSNTNEAGKGFLNLLMSQKRLPCFSIYNIIKLKPYNDIFDKFLGFFGTIPCLMMFPYKEIIKKEYECFQKNYEFIIDSQIAYALLP